MMMIELIEREETIKALVDEAKIIDGKRFEEPNLQHVFDFGGIIRSMPTVQAVPIEELQEIRQKITNLVKTYPFINHKDTYVKEEEVLEIINKHIKQIEGSGEE